MTQEVAESAFSDTALDIAFVGATICLGAPLSLEKHHISQYKLRKKELDSEAREIEVILKVINSKTPSKPFQCMGKNLFLKRNLGECGAIYVLRSMIFSSWREDSPAVIVYQFADIATKEEISQGFMRQTPIIVFESKEKGGIPK